MRGGSCIGNDAEPGISDVGIRSAEVDPVKEIECLRAKLYILQALDCYRGFGYDSLDRVNHAADNSAIIALSVTYADTGSQVPSQ